MGVLIPVYPLYLTIFLARRAVTPRSGRVIFLIDVVSCCIRGVWYLIEIKMSHDFSLTLSERITEEPVTVRLYRFSYGSCNALT
jgi:hypothetical protein